MGQRLSDADLARYRDEGYLCPITVLTPAEAAHYRARLEAAEAAAGGSLPGPFKHKPHLVYPWAQELVRHPAILDAVEEVIGPDILCWESVFFNKEPKTQDFVSWHQDVTYWGLDQEGDVVTAWVALSPSTPESGCMRVVPGTHKRDVVAHQDTFGEATCSRAARRSRSRSTRTTRSTSSCSPARCRCTTSRCSTARAKPAADRRLGFAIRYLPPSVHQQVGADSATLVRGEDRFGWFEHEPAPSGDLDPAAVALHKAVRERRTAILMRGAARPSRAAHTATAM